MARTILVLFLCLAGVGANSEAQEKAQLAVLDYGVLFKEYYKAAQSKQLLMKKEEEYNKDFKEKAGAVNEIILSAQKLQDDLQSPVLSESKKKEILGQLKDKKSEVESRQKLFMEYRDQCMGVMQKMQAQENEAVLGEINKATAIVAKNKYTIVFAKPQGAPLPGAVTFNEGIDDITQQVLALLNKDAPSGGTKKEEKK